jgi:hypothetical protein
MTLAFNKINGLDATVTFQQRGISMHGQHHGGHGGHAHHSHHGGIALLGVALIVNTLQTAGVPVFAILVLWLLH